MHSGVVSLIDIMFAVSLDMAMQIMKMTLTQVVQSLHVF